MKKTKDKMRMKWIKIFWSDIKRFISNYGLAIITVVVLVTINYYARALANAKNDYIQELEKNNKFLENELNNTLEINKDLGEAYDELLEENQLFGSMLGQIEYEEGGHEMLDKLYNEYK
jgi:hypothetical protein